MVENYISKKGLKRGDIVVFHDWGSGGSKIGIIVEKILKDDPWKSNLNIWRPKEMYFLMSPTIDHITVIKVNDALKSYQQREFVSVIDEAKKKHIL